jgi:hypothetical protein
MQNVSPEHDAAFLSLITFWWMTGVQRAQSARVCHVRGSH